MIKINNPDSTDLSLKATKVTKDLIRAACGPLLEILADETVSVIHHSFTEYLKGTTRSDDAVGYPILKPGPTHAQLAIACLRYLMAGDAGGDDDSIRRWSRSSRNNDLSKNVTQLRMKYPFFEYAVSNCSFHVNKSEAADQDQMVVDAKIGEFLGHRRNMNVWLRIKWVEDYTSSAGVTQVHIAAREGLVSYIKGLLQTMDADAPDQQGRTPLWWAARSGHAAVVRVLLEAGARSDQDDRVYGLKPLHKAANKNHSEVVKLLLEAVVNPLTEKMRENPGRRCGNSPRSTGHTPLMYACENGHLQAVEAFLPFLGNIDTVHRALAWAAKRGQAKVVARILQHPGVDANAVVKGETTLYLACGSGNVETIRCLVDAGADPNALSADDDDEFAGTILMGSRPVPKNNCLHRLCETYSSRRAYGQKDSDSTKIETIYSILVEAGADVHHRASFNSTTLHKAVGSSVLTRLLIRSGVDPNIMDNGGATALHLTTGIDTMVALIEEGHADLDMARNDEKTPLLCLLSTYHTESAMKFLEYGPDCTKVDNEGNGALHITMKEWNSNADLIRALIERGADPNLRNRQGLTPLHLAKRDIKDDNVEAMIESGADINATDRNGHTVLFKSISSQSNEDGKELKNLLKRGASGSIRDNKGRTVFHQCANVYEAGYSQRDGRKSQLELFLDIDVGNINIHTVDFGGNSLLHELALRKDNHDSYSGPKLVLFWELVADLGETPLHILCGGDLSHARFQEGTILPIDFVISRTKDFEKQDKDGATPLHRAVVGGGEFYVKELLDAGVDPTALTYEGLSALHLAARFRDSKTVGLLLDSLKKNTSTEKMMEAVNLVPYGRYQYTPLYYACLSRRSETVALLLEAGADIQPDVFTACSNFENEHSLWKVSAQEMADEQAPRCAVRLADQRRPRNNVVSYNRGPAMNELETARLEEILELLVRHKADISGLTTHKYSYNGGFIDNAVSNGKMYTARCMTDIIQKHWKEGMEDQIRSGRKLFQLLDASKREAFSKVLEASSLVEPGEAKRELIVHLLEQREFGLVEQIAQLGARFFPSPEEDVWCSFSLLVKSGYTSLVDKIGTISAQEGLQTGEWHAFGDSSKPGLWYAMRNIEKNGNKGENPIPFLIEAVQRDLPNMGVVELFVDKFGVDINEMRFHNVYEDGKYALLPTESPIHYVSRGDNWWHVNQALPYLIKASAQLESRNEKGQTPLLFALKGGDYYPGPFHRDAARILIESGADVNAVDKNGHSCLACAQHDVESIKLLISYGATVMAGSIIAAIDAKNLSVLQALLSGGVDADIREKNPRKEDKSGNGTRKRRRKARHFLHKPVSKQELFPLYHAGVALKKLDKPTNHDKRNLDAGFKIVQALLDSGADVFAELPLKMIMLRLMIRLGAMSRHLDIAKARSYMKLDVNHRDPRGYTLLHAACSGSLGPDHIVGKHEDGADPKDKPTLFQTILSLRADIEAKDKYGRNMLHHMIGNDGYIQYNHSNDFTKSFKEAIKLAPHLMDQADIYGNTPLHFAVSRAARRGGEKPTAILLEAGADPLKIDNKGNNMLHKLAEGQRFRRFCTLYEDLVKRGVDINGRADGGKTPLYKFCKSTGKKPDSRYIHHSDEDEEPDPSIPLFTRLGADFFVRDNKGRGLLHACASGNVGTFSELLDQGLDAMLEDEANQTAIDVAAACGNSDVLELFEKKA
ncbi:unnamed protein product [Clonostachys chloroleuca]|uniref:Uncharacterized protein n=1 Tax=Clonostachys chloroleuca TaxID=1926264 RepID=A0AA35LRA9_9HYPO|nr:unnamed protein product [Clonostachys chloroleuca]